MRGKQNAPVNTPDVSQPVPAVSHSTRHLIHEWKHFESLHLAAMKPSRNPGMENLSIQPVDQLGRLLVTCKVAPTAAPISSARERAWRWSWALWTTVDRPWVHPGRDWASCLSPSTSFPSPTITMGLFDNRYGPLLLAAPHELTVDDSTYPRRRG